MTKLLLDRGACVDHVTPIGETPLTIASRMGAFDTVKLLLESGADANHTRHDGCPVVIFAFDKDIVEILLDFGADVNSAHDGFSLLHNHYDKIETVKFLIGRGAFVNPMIREEYNILNTVCFCGRADVLRCLLENGADQDAKDNDTSETPMHECFAENVVECVEILVEYGADVNSPDMYGSTPLHKALSCGRFDSAKLLLENGANVETKNERGETPLDVAFGIDVEELLRETRRGGVT